MMPGAGIAHCSAYCSRDLRYLCRGHRIPVLEILVEGTGRSFGRGSPHAIDEADIAIEAAANRSRNHREPIRRIEECPRGGLRCDAEHGLRGFKRSLYPR